LQLEDLIFKGSSFSPDLFLLDIDIFVNNFALIHTTAAVVQVLCVTGRCRYTAS